MRPQIKAIAVFVLLSMTLFKTTNAAGPIHPYYPAKLLQQIDSGSNNLELKKSIHYLLKKIHVASKGKRDILVDRCTQRTGEYCYSHKYDFSYEKARRYLFGTLHLFKDNGKYFILDNYCEKKLYGSKNGVGPNQIPNHKYVNCEHTWPQSLFNKRPDDKNAQLVDLHHLFPVASRANSARQNIPFGEVIDTPSSRVCNISFRGKTEKNPRRTSFEPPEKHKGNVARAMFYFSIRYRLKIDNVMERYLKQWHKLDPVDKYEAWRNNKIFMFQNTRNPFIDMPELVEAISDF